MSGVNLPSSSIITLEMPDKIIFSANEGEIETRKVQLIAKCLADFINDDSTVVCYLPDNLTLLLFYKEGRSRAISLDQSRGDLHSDSTEEGSGDTGLTGGDPEGWEDSEDDHE